MKKKIMSTILAAATLVTMLTGCGGQTADGERFPFPTVVKS